MTMCEIAANAYVYSVLPVAFQKCDVYFGIAYYP